MSNGSWRPKEQIASQHQKCHQRQLNGASHLTAAPERETDESAVLYSKITDPPPMIINSSGCYLFTSDGRVILDSTSGAAVAAIGHNHPRVKEAVLRQLDKISYCWAPFFTTEPAEALAKYLSETSNGMLSKAFIVSSGTEAIEAAMKLARQFYLEPGQNQPQRTKFIARRQSYHGNTLGSLALGGHVPRKAPYLPILATNISHVSPCYPYRDRAEGETDEGYVRRLAQELEEEFQKVGPDQVCAFVMETMAGSTLGSIPPAPGYVRAMKEVCERHGALFVLDEVMSGMGRTGSMHAWESEGVVPDLQAVAKGLGAGYGPIGALLIHEKVVSALRNGSGSFMHSQTYQGHPLACAAAFEVQQIIRDENLLENVRETGEYLGSTLRTKISDHKNVGDIRGRGLLWGIEFVDDKETKQPFSPDRGIAASLSKVAMQDHCITLIPIKGVADGMAGDAVQIAPPYNVTRAEIDLIVERVANTVKQVLG